MTALRRAPDLAPIPAAGVRVPPPSPEAPLAPRRVDAASALRATSRPRLLLRQLRTTAGSDPGRLRVDLDLVAVSVDVAGAFDLGRVEFDEDEGWESVDFRMGRSG